jgi:cathepsin F
MSKVKYLIIFILCVYLVKAELQEGEIDRIIFTNFQNFIKTFNKTYSSNEELQARSAVFKDNFMHLESNLKTSNQSFSSGITRFFDMTSQEFHKEYLNLDLSLSEVIQSQKSKGSWMNRQDQEADLNYRDFNSKKNLKENSNNSTGRNLQTLILPESYDWRLSGIVGPVRNQLTCGSCWAFTAVFVIECRYALKYGIIENFSEQQLVNCDYLNNGCQGGITGRAFNYLQYYSEGLVRETSLPYVNYKYECNLNNLQPIVKVTDWMFSGTTRESTIAKMLYTYGPLSVAINAKFLQYYQGGIIDASDYDCNIYDLNHAVNLVGWGVENGVKFWIVRNAWGPNWGEGGYFRIARDKGTCGINQYVLTAFVE